MGITHSCLFKRKLEPLLNKRKVWFLYEIDYDYDGNGFIVYGFYKTKKAAVKARDDTAVGDYHLEIGETMEWVK